MLDNVKQSLLGVTHKLPEHCSTKYNNKNVGPCYGIFSRSVIADLDGYVYVQLLESRHFQLKFSFVGFFSISSQSALISIVQSVKMFLANHRELLVGTAFANRYNFIYVFILIF